MISIDHLSLTLGGQSILQDISASVSRGSCVTLIGPSGSGKSSLLRCVNGLEKPTAGSVVVDTAHVGMVFQHFHLFPHMTVLQNLTYAPIRVNKKSIREAEDRGLALLERVGLLDKRAAYPAGLSGGQKQRVAIARALAMDPDVLLFDEPTSALDPEMVWEVLQVIESLAHTDMTLMIVTHEMGFAKNVSDEVWFLERGSLLEKTPAKSFFAGPATERATSFLKKVLHHG